MSVSVLHNGTLYLSSREAGKLAGYTSDYVARLARQGKIAATRVGTQWFVDPQSLDAFLKQTESAKIQRSEKLRQERHVERQRIASSAHQQVFVPAQGHHVDLSITDLEDDPDYSVVSHIRAHVMAISVVCLGLTLAFSNTFLSSQHHFVDQVSSRLHNEAKITAYGFYHLLTDTSVSSIANISVAGITDEKSAQSEHSAEYVMAEETGIVVLPESATEDTVRSVKDSFSDDVSVTLDSSGTSGIIVPQFHDGEGEQYRFVMVPIENNTSP